MNHKSKTKFIRYGDSILVHSNTPISIQEGEKYLKKFEWAKKVFQLTNIEGEMREPTVIHLAGSKNSEVAHKENGLIYLFDLKHTIFSPGNQKFRKLLIDKVEQNDRLLDMFAAVGNLSLQPAYFSKCKLIALEKNPVTFHFLRRTMNLNKVAGDFFNIDSRCFKIRNWATKVFMGFFYVNFQHITVAVLASSPKFKLFIHALSQPNGEIPLIELYSKWLIELKCVIKKAIWCKIKSYSRFENHIQITFTLEKASNFCEDYCYLYSG